MFLGRLFRDRIAVWGWAGSGAGLVNTILSRHRAHISGTMHIKVSLGSFLIDLVFGKQIGDSAEEGTSPTYRYQRRQNNPGVLAGLLAWGFACFVVWKFSHESMAAGIAVSFGLLAALTIPGIAAASDAIFDSGCERINFQSAWLHIRVNKIELNTSKDGRLKGQESWNDVRESMDEAAHYHTCPEWNWMGHEATTRTPRMPQVCRGFHCKIIVASARESRCP